MRDAAQPAGTHLMIATTRFGTVEMMPVAPSHLYTFPEALPGLPDSHRYALIEDAAYLPLRWLQSLDDTQVCLPVLPLGGASLGEYAAHVGSAVGLEDADAAGRVLLVTRYDSLVQSFVANLLAPIVLEPETGVGRQLVLEGTSYPLRQPLTWDPEQRMFSLPC